MFTLQMKAKYIWKVFVSSNAKSGAGTFHKNGFKKHTNRYF